MKKIEIPSSSREGGKVNKIIKVIIVLAIVLMRGLTCRCDTKYQSTIKNEISYDVVLDRFDSYQKKKVDKKNTGKKVIVKTKTTIKNTKGKSISNFAIQFNGNPYVYGGTSLTNGADCSGFVQSVYKNFGKTLPRTVVAQSKVGTTISFKELQPGDLVFYSNGGSKPSHVALYIGNGKIIHASTPQGGIKISPVNIMTKVKAKRIKL